MIRLLAFIVVTTFVLSGCSAYHMGDALPKLTPPNAQTAPVVIGVNATPRAHWAVYVAECKELEQTAAQVFSQYGWKTVQDQNAPIILDLQISEDKYTHPGFGLLFALSASTLPSKIEEYITVSARVVINGTVQSNLSYTANLTKYFTFYSPFSLFAPATHYTTDPYPPEVLSKEAHSRALIHIAEDIRAKYLSGNYQQSRI